MRTAILAVILAAAPAAASACSFDAEMKAVTLGSLLAAVDRCGLSIDERNLNRYVERNIPECARMEVASPVVSAVERGLTCSHARLSASSMGILAGSE